jgi:threonine synthase
VNLPPLQCRSCGREFDVAELVWRCPCGGMLDLGGRWQPVTDPAVTLGEGNTPMIVSKRLPGVRFKLEFLSPTGSFKDRGAVVLASLARRLGVGRAVVDSSGNAGTAVAAYFARAGIDCEVLVPASTSAEKLAQIRAHGATLTLVPGSRADTAAAAMEIADRQAVFYASHVYHPYFMHGVKTYGYEIWQQSGRRLPSAVLVPVGNGTLLLGCYLAFTELVASGLADRMPSILAVQAAGCAPLASAWDGQDRMLGSTVAEGIAITAPPRAEQILAAVHASGGTIVTVSDDAIVAGRRALAHEGLFVEPTAAVCYAAAAGAPELAPSDVVIPLCGAGLKHPGD